MKNPKSKRAPTLCLHSGRPVVLSAVLRFKKTDFVFVLPFLGFLIERRGHGWKIGIQYWFSLSSLFSVLLSDVTGAQVE